MPEKIGHFFYDVALDGFNPDDHVLEHGPRSVWNYQTELPTYRKLILGGIDGYLRNYHPALATDDGETIDSEVMFSPVRLYRGGYQEGKLVELIAAIAEGSGDVDWELRVGNSHQEAVEADARLTGTWDGTGLQHMVRPRLRAASVVLMLKAGESAGWSVEKVICRAVPAGRTRLP